LRLTDLLPKKYPQPVKSQTLCEFNHGRKTFRRLDKCCHCVGTAKGRSEDPSLDT
jgi:hypothetical protein